MSDRQRDGRRDRNTQILLDLRLTCENIDLFPELQDLEVSLERLGGRHPDLGRCLGLGNTGLGVGNPSVFEDEDFAAFSAELAWRS